ncbi:MAG: hypothetical protein NT133_14440 [Alphaproteobacteria bacterium]|nr:hypothetical protein [Alphaproteobacteria bacterium]
MNALVQQYHFAGARTDYFVFAPVRERSRAKTCELVPATPSCISMGMSSTDPIRTVIADEATLIAWSESAPSGAQSIYHVGHLASDRAQETSRLAAAARVALNSTADSIMMLVARGSVIAVQQQLANGQIVYLAIKAQQRSSRSRAPRGNLPPSQHCHVPGVTSRTDDITAAHIPSPSGNSSSPVNTSIAASSVAR